MAISDKPEFPPLLQSGLQAMGLSELKRLTVDEFPLSTRRRPIFDGLEKIVLALNQSKIQCEIWVDGSFLTKKIDPADCDLVVRVTAEFVESCSVEQYQILNWINTDLRTTLLCDSYIFAEWPEGHSGHLNSMEVRAYWMGWFGHDRRSGEKGIAVIMLP